MNRKWIRIKEQNFGVSTHTLSPTKEEDFMIFISDCKIIVRDRYVVKLSLLAYCAR
jgi:hypothetical protein